MTELTPRAEPRESASAMRAAHNAGRNLLGLHLDGSSLLNAYRNWVVEQGRYLGSYLEVAAVDAILHSPRYFALLSIDPSTYGSGLRPLVAAEIERVCAELDSDASAVDVEASRWSHDAPPARPSPVTQAVILDANVLMEFSQEIPSIDWGARYFSWRGDGVALAVPMAVVRELDRLKRDRGDMWIDGVKHPRRTLARAALRFLTDNLEGPLHSTVLRPMNEVAQEPGELRVVLMVDPPRHVPLEYADAEILDRALALRAYVRHVAVATSDQSMAFQCEAQGLAAKSPVDKREVD